MSKKRLLLLRLILLSMLSSLYVVACTDTLPGSFPDTDIVYQSKNYKEKTAGFSNADGSDNNKLSLEFYVNRPVWSTDGKTLYFLQVFGDNDYGTAGVSNERGGQISIWREGRGIKICKNKYFRGVSSIEHFLPSFGGSEALIVNAIQQIMTYDLDRCKVRKIFVDVTDDQYILLEGASLSSDGRYLVYTEGSITDIASPTYTIKIMDTDTRETIDIGEGINPAWYPDNTWIAYVKIDGIDIMAADSSQNNRLIEYDTRRDSTDGVKFATASPAPRWSPCGDWLVYHKCTNPEGICKYASDFSIFKVNVTTGEEIKILDGGVYPYWRER